MLIRLKSNPAGAPTIQIILWIVLTDREGIELRKNLSLVANTPVIVLTGLVDEKVTAEALKKGAQDYLVKGDYDKKLLEKTIRYAIERKHNQELLKQSEEEYKLLFENNPVPMWAYDANTMNIVTVTHRLCCTRIFAG